MVLQLLLDENRSTQSRPILFVLALLALLALLVPR